LPLTVKEIQPLLSGDEAMVLFAVTEVESYVIAITRESFDWKPIPRGAETLSQKIAAFRRGLDLGKASDASGKSALFDLALAHELHETLLAPVDALIKDKPSLLVVASGALDGAAVPFAGDREAGGGHRKYSRATRCGLAVEASGGVGIAVGRELEGAAGVCSSEVSRAQSR
jgi:hypothetical protein